MNWLALILINGIAVYVAAYILPGVSINSAWTALIVGLVLGVVNAFIKPILVFLTLPITLITLGLFILVINGLLVLGTSLLVPGFVVENIWWAILFSIVISLISSFLQNVTNAK
jgi:putative membrane protein